MSVVNERQLLLWPPVYANIDRLGFALIAWNMAIWPFRAANDDF